MTVADLILKLQEIEDKTLAVYKSNFPVYETRCEQFVGQVKVCGIRQCEGSTEGGIPNRVIL
jgi:hypothetical protein